MADDSSTSSSTTCFRGCNVCRSLCKNSPDRYCCIFPANVWLKLRMGAIVGFLVGLFLVIIFPLPDMILFKVAIGILTVAGCFVLVDIGRGMLASCQSDMCPRPTSESTTAERVVELSSRATFEEYDNPAMTDDGDLPPDYAAAIASSPAGPNSAHRRPPDITIDVDNTLAGMMPRNDFSDSADIRSATHNPSLSPGSEFSFRGPQSPQSPPPSYDDVIKEDREQRQIASLSSDPSRGHQGEGQSGQEGQSQEPPRQDPQRQDPDSQEHLNPEPPSEGRPSEQPSVEEFPSTSSTETRTNVPSE